MKVHPLTGKPNNGKARREVVEQLASAPIRARYDAAQDTDDFKRYWANADTHDADSANSKAVREKLVPRSRYEVSNNGYSDGIAQTYATDLVGTGPRLRMESGSPGFNQMVEAEFARWASTIQLRRKLWCQAIAKHVDGEGFGVARTNPGLAYPVQLDYVLYETEQFQTPMLADIEPGYIDGIRFDRFGNPIWYDLMRAHPGNASGAGLDLVPERLPPNVVMHWYLLRRPGQHRGVPEMASTLNTGAAHRRWREATLAAAETAADFALLLKTQMSPSEEDHIDPFLKFEIEKRMMTAIPAGWDPFQMKAEHPNTTHESFHRSQVNELARPRSMPYNKAACDSSSYNFASGRLDHQTYYGALDVDRADGEALVLTPLFELWFPEALKVFGWLNGDPATVNPAARRHSWDWPKHFAADIKAETQAAATRLQTGQVTLSRLYSENGLDFEDELATMSRDYGVTPDEMRDRLLNTIFAGAATATAAAPEESDDDPDATN